MPSLTVTSPSSGDTWYKDTQYTISWSTTGNVMWQDGWAVYLYDGTGLVDTVATGLASSIRSRNYTTDDNLDSDNDFYVIVSGSYESGGV